MLVQSPRLSSNALDPLVAHYFEAFNQGDYATVAALFSDRGLLLPPFETEIVGSAAIANYLTQEAIGMQAMPLDSQVEQLSAGDRQITVKGRVKTPLFTVNVQWIFVITPADTLQQVEIKLLASLQELLQFNRK